MLCVRTVGEAILIAVDTYIIIAVDSSQYVVDVFVDEVVGALSVEE